MDDPQSSNMAVNVPQKRVSQRKRGYHWLSLVLALTLFFWAGTPTVFGSQLAQTVEPTGEATEEATGEATVEATSEVTTTVEATPELTTTVEATPEVTTTVEATPEVTTTVEATPEADEEEDQTDELAGTDCAELTSHADLTAALVEVVTAADSGGFGFNMWATLVNRDGEVCAVTFSGENRGDQFPASRIVSAQKANTANALSLPGIALSTANLYTAVQPGNSLFGLQESSPVNTTVAYAGDAMAYGQEDDPLVGSRIGGINVFGGGLALYDEDGNILGGVGVSGDTSCTDHIIAWKLRDALGLDYVPGGVSLTGDDNIVFDQSSGWAHPECGSGEVEISDALLTDYPIGAE